MELGYKKRLSAAVRSYLGPAIEKPVAPAGRMNARPADRAGAWFQEMDRLETTRDRGKSADHCLCDQDLGPYAEGRRYRRDPDRADRNPTGSYCPRRIVRGLRIL